MADLNLSASPSGGKNPKTSVPKASESKGGATGVPKLRMSPAGDHSPVSRTAGAIIGVVSVVALALAIFLSNPTAPTTQGTGTGTAATASSVTPTGHTTRVSVGVEGMAFTPNHIEVPVGDRLIIDFTNSGDQRHDLVFETGVSSGSLATGETKELDLGIIAGDVEGWCSLPGHREMGMTLHVQATGASSSSSGASASGSHGSHKELDLGIIAGDVEGWCSLPGHREMGMTLHVQATGASSSSSGASASGSHGSHAGHDHGQEAAAGPASPTALTDYAATITPRDPVLPPTTSETERSYTFAVTEQTTNVTDTLTRQTWTFNGDAPGPILRGHIGDTFHITLVNNGTMSHSLDFHAGLVAPDNVMHSIEPGQTLEYTFVAKNAGIWLYHCSTAPMSMHIANGMFGAVIIDPTDLDTVDREYVMIASELYLGADGQSADASLLSALQPNAMAFNGVPFQYKAHPIQIRTNERVRVWVMDAGPNLATTFHVVGTQFDTVWREGAYVIRGGGSGGGWGQVLSLGAAEGGFVEFTPLEVGHYSFVNHALSLAEKGQTGVFEVSD